MQTTSLMSSYEGSVGTSSWYGNWYSSRIPTINTLQKSHIPLWCRLAFRRCYNYLFTPFTSWDAATCNLPENEPKTVHVSHDVRLKVTSVQSLFQNLWRHVALCTDSCIGGNIYFICVTKESDIKVIRTKITLNTWIPIFLIIHPK